MAKENSELIHYIDKKFEELKENFIKNLRDDLLSNLSSLLNEQSKEIQRLNECVMMQESTIEVLQSSVASLKTSKESTLGKIDELEAYSRRQCLRIDGVELVPNESNDMVLTNVMNYFVEAQVKIPEVAVDRVHRIGPKYKNNRKNLTNHKSVKIDLTKKRYQLLKNAQDLLSKTLLEEGIEDNIYVYADVNCRLKIVNKDMDESSFFESLDDVRNICSA